MVGHPDRPSSDLNIGGSFSLPTAFPTAHLSQCLGGRRAAAAYLEWFKRFLRIVRSAPRLSAGAHPPGTSADLAKVSIRRHRRRSQRHNPSRRHGRQTPIRNTSRQCRALHGPRILSGCRRADLWDLGPIILDFRDDPRIPSRDFPQLSVGGLRRTSHRKLFSRSWPVVARDSMVARVFRRPVVLRSAAQSSNAGNDTRRR